MLENNHQMKLQTPLLKAICCIKEHQYSIRDPSLNHHPTLDSKAFDMSLNHRNEANWKLIFDDEDHHAGSSHHRLGAPLKSSALTYGGSFQARLEGT